MAQHSSIFVLTGAGISAESGIATFRGGDGLWEGERVEDVATPEAFARNPERVWRFYNQRRNHLAKVHPNAAHHALASLEKQFGADLLVVTQNVDDLHERAGSQALLHMHGELLQGWCLACNQRFAWQGDMDAHSQCPHCQAIGQIRPDIVWFGEMPYHIGTAAAL
jgi:NAD-dependent deacetylase